MELVENISVAKNGIWYSKDTSTGSDGQWYTITQLLGNDLQPIPGVQLYNAKVRVNRMGNIELKGQVVTPSQDGVIANILDFSQFPDVLARLQAALPAYANESTIAVNMGYAPLTGYNTPIVGYININHDDQTYALAIVGQASNAAGTSESYSLNATIIL